MDGGTLYRMSGATQTSGEMDNGSWLQNDLEIRYGGVLLSPTGAQFQHQGRVIVHARLDEDDPVTEVIVEANGDTSTRGPIPDSARKVYGAGQLISRRRNGLAIEFHEEDPDAPHYWLWIYQEKGMTVIEWRTQGPREVEQ